MRGSIWAVVVTVVVVAILFGAAPGATTTVTNNSTNATHVVHNVTEPLGDSVIGGTLVLFVAALTVGAFLMDQEAW